MTNDERFNILAKAIKELAERAAYTWDYDGEQRTSAGVRLSPEVSMALDEIIRTTEKAAPKP